MGEFDDVLAVGPGDDWDTWDEWAASAEQSGRANAAEQGTRLNLAGLVVELRGEFDGSLLESVANLVLDPSVEANAVIRLDVRSVGGRTLIEVPGRDETVVLGGGAYADNGTDTETGAFLPGADHLSLLDVLFDLLASQWPQVAALEGSFVDLPASGCTHGVLVLGDDTAHRREVLAELIVGGARLVAADRVLLRSGTRSVPGLPTDLEQVVAALPHTDGLRFADSGTIDAVILLDPGQEEAIRAECLSPAEGFEFLVGRLMGLGMVAPLSSSLAGTVLGGADVWRIVGAPAARSAQFIAELPTWCDRRIVTIEPAAPTHDDLRRLVRFRGSTLDRDEGVGAVLVDHRHATVERVVDPDSVVQPCAMSRWAFDEAASSPGASRPEPAVATLHLIDDLIDDLTDETVVPADPVATADNGDARVLVIGSLVVAHDGLYPPWLFASDRVDLLVDRGFRSRLVEALVSRGYSAASSPGLSSESSPDVHGASAVELRSADEAVTVGLHCQLSVGPFGTLVDHDELHARAVPIRIGGRWFMSLHPADRLVHTALLAAEDPSDVSLLRSIAQLAPDDPDLAAEALEAAERWGAVQALLAAVRGAQKEFGGIDPWLVARAGRKPSGRARGTRIRP